MENPIQNGTRTNHDRGPWMNGINGGGSKRDISDKGKALVEMANGGDGSLMEVDSEPHDGSMMGTVAAPHHSSLDDLPDEIQHITTDILPLGLIVARLAQFSHVQLQEEIKALASKPLPQAIANGNASYQFTGVEDTSPESLHKKVELLKFAQDLHTRWVKVLVIAEWSKKARKVSKLIDIRSHLASKFEEFNQVFFNLVNAKRDLHWAKLPSPDLKTALEALSSGEISWMPEFGYLEPPPISLEEREAWIDNINTMLNVRLGVHECEKIPLAFSEYTIQSGRVTFRVEGEFEVDLTIGDEDFDKQFWFIDFRFLFNPAPAELSEPLRLVLEAKVNDVLSADGLAGCYKYLHEFVLTHKITEFWHQAVELSRTRWIETLKVERLNRAMAIQYWVNRPHSQGSKSWIILGVNTGAGPDGVPDPKSPSHLALRWFRDNKEVKDFDIPFSVDTISTEELLTTVIARHVEYLLGSIYSKLVAKPRFSQRQARLSLEISSTEPLDSSLEIQLFDRETATVRIDSMVGSFTMLPPSPHILDGQKRLNLSPNPAEDGPVTLEQLRWYYTLKDLSSRVKSIGWIMMKNLIPAEELRNMVQAASQSREVFQATWLRKVGWAPQWFLVMTMSLGGDQWWLVELSTQKPGLQGGRMKLFTKVPMATSQLILTDTFFEDLTVYVTGMISQITDLRELHTNHMNHASRPSANYSLPLKIKLPAIYVRLSDMLRPRSGAAEPFSATWAKDFIPICFRGIRPPSDDNDGVAGAVMAQPRRDSRIKITAEARITVTNRSRFQLLKGNIDHDVSFDARVGQFVLRLRTDMGTPVVTLLATRLRSLDRLVNYIEAIQRAGKDVVPVSVTLREVVFIYRRGGGSNNGINDPAATALPDALRPESRAWRVRLDLTREQGVGVTLDRGNPHLRVLDFLQTAAENYAFENIPSWLIFTLPLFRGVEKIEEAWKGIAARNEGLFQVFHKNLNWMTLRFSLGPRRILTLDIRPHNRKGKAMWHVRRPEQAGDNSAAIPGSRNDEFDRVLQQRVWSVQGDGIKGLGTSAAAESGAGIEKLMSLVDDAVRALVGTPPGGVSVSRSQELSSAPGTGAPQQPPQPPQPGLQQQQARFSGQHQHRQHHQQPNGQVHQRGGGGGVMGSSSNTPLVVLD